MKPVWIVDDDQGIRWVLEKALAKVSIVTRSFSNAKDVSYALKEEIPAALISDIRMPGMDGLTLLKEIKDKYPALPVIIMTAFSDLNSTVAAFQGGAFDYLAKPFEPKELVLRIEAILRRTLAMPQAASLSLGVCRFDVARGELSRDGEPLRLTEAEARLLKRLAANPHAPIDRLDLAQDAADPTGRAVDIQVTRLRRKIETDPKNPRYLQTVRGVGYMLAPD